MAFACLACLSPWCEVCAEPEPHQATQGAKVCPKCGAALVAHKTDTDTQVSAVFASELHACRRAFGPAPRTWSSLIINRLALPWPEWLTDNDADDLAVLFQNAERIWQEGDVVWAHLVQANQMLFDPNDDDSYPAEVVYCTDPTASVSPMALGDVAGKIYDLKGTIPTDPELRRAAELVTNEMSRSFRTPIPKVLTGGLPCARSVIYVVRAHLPTHHLESPWMPVVAMSKAPYLVSPLPYFFWTRKLIAMWT